MKTLEPIQSILPDLSDAASLLGDGSSAFENRFLGRSPPRRTFLEKLIRDRARFGISRVGSLTRLDRVGIPVVQAVRPLSRSNSVAQGKGMTFEHAALSAVMEAIEIFAAEDASGWPLRVATATSLGNDVADLYTPWVDHEQIDSWQTTDIPWLDGWNLFNERIIKVPLALVDTDYSWPSPHQRMFWRTTTGLGAGFGMGEAFLQAAFEVLERDTIAAAFDVTGFFDDHQIDPESIADDTCISLLKRIRAAGIMVGLWIAPARHGLPVIWCQFVEEAGPDRRLPLPVEGFGCHFRSEMALQRALLEACQARLTAISGAREDITRDQYPKHHDEPALDRWRARLKNPNRSLNFASCSSMTPRDWREAVSALRNAFEAAGATSCVVVPLMNDEQTSIAVLRLLAPPLRPASMH